MIPSSLRQWRSSVRFVATLLLFGLPLSAQAASSSRYPFPRMAAMPYPHGLAKAAGVSANASEVQRTYQEWLDTFYVEGVCGALPCARIRFDDRTYTVSEGIGYGMLILAYMDNAQNDTRSKFDRLWAYYNAFLDRNGLMNWKVQGFEKVVGSGAATDAELDVALALMLAYKQWGDTAHLGAARRMVDRIRRYEVDSDTLLKPGDGWNTAKNPSYLSTMAMRLFDSLPGQDGRWRRIVEKSYDLLDRNVTPANSPTGLPSDWCEVDGAPAQGTAEAAGNFGYESVRTPWRMAVAHAWFGDTVARRVAGNVAAFAIDARYSIGGKVGNLLDGYRINDGGVFESKDYKPSYTAVFVGAFGVAGMVDPKYRDWVDQCYDTLGTSTTGGWYYDKILQVMFGLVMSGNFNNLWMDSPPASGLGVRLAPRPTPTLAIVRTGKRGMASLAGQKLIKGWIVSVDGRELRSLTPFEGGLVVDLSRLPTATYLVRAQAADGVVHSQFLALP